MVLQKQTPVKVSPKCNSHKSVLNLIPNDERDLVICDVWDASGSILLPFFKGDVFGDEVSGDGVSGGTSNGGG
jgi:hypothetical protein